VARALDIAAGERHSLAVEAGTRLVVAFGSNDRDQLGLGEDVEGASFPTAVGGAPVPAAAVFAGASSSTSFALGADGAAFAWGNNAYGACCCSGTQQDRTVVAPRAVAVDGGRRIASVSCSHWGAALLTEAGEVLASSTVGQRVSPAKPIAPLGARPCSAIAAVESSPASRPWIRGANFSLYGVDEDCVFCWGWDWQSAAARLDSPAPGDDAWPGAKRTCLLRLRDLPWPGGVRQRIVSIGASDSMGTVGLYLLCDGGTVLRCLRCGSPDSAPEEVTTGDRGGRARSLFVGGHNIFVVEGLFEAKPRSASPTTTL